MFATQPVQSVPFPHVTFPVCNQNRHFKSDCESFRMCRGVFMVLNWQHDFQLTPDMFKSYFYQTSFLKKKKKKYISSHSWKKKSHTSGIVCFSSSLLLMLRAFQTCAHQAPPLHHEIFRLSVSPPWEDSSSPGPPLKTPEVVMTSPTAWNASAAMGLCVSPVGREFAMSRGARS